MPLTEHTLKTKRRTTFYLAAGPEDGPLVIFVHGWPELSVRWRHQLPALAALGFRAIAPDMRGYGRSTVYLERRDRPLVERVGPGPVEWPPAGRRVPPAPALAVSRFPLAGDHPGVPGPRGERSSAWQHGKDAQGESVQS